MSVPIKTLDRKHPDWVKYNSAWTQLGLMNKGGIDQSQAAASFLQMKPKELPDVFQLRTDAYFAQPLLGQITGWYVAKLFQREPKITRTGGNPDYWDAWMEDVDRAGMRLTDAGRIALEDFILYGRSYWLTDKPRPTDDVVIQTHADELAAGLDRTYVVRFAPEEVINWADDDAGNLKWAIVKVRHLQQAGPIDDSQIINTWYVFDKTNYWIYEAEEKDSDDLTPSGAQDDGEQRAEQVATGEHVLASVQRVPLRRFKVQPSHWMANKAFTLLREFNGQENAFGWGLRQANSPMPYVITADDMGTFTNSPVGYMHFSDPNTKIGYLEPEGKSFAITAEYMGSLREEVFRSFYSQAQGRTSSASASAQSGFSKQMDMQPSNDVLNAFGDYETRFLSGIVQDSADARNEKVTVEITGFRFESRPALEDVETAEALVELGIGNYSVTAEKELIKRAALSGLDDADSELKTTISDEIDAAKGSAELAQQAAEQQQQMFSQSFEKASNKADASGLIKDESAAAA